MGERLRQIAERTGAPLSVRLADRLMGGTLLMQGRNREAQGGFERVLRSPIAPGDRHGVIFYISNDHALARSMLARALWMQGFTESALNQSFASLEDVRGGDNQ